MNAKMGGAPKNKMAGKAEPAKCQCGARLPDYLEKAERCPYCNRKIPDRQSTPKS